MCRSAIGKHRLAERTETQLKAGVPYLSRLSKHAVQVAPEQEGQYTKSYGTLRHVDHTSVQRR